MFAFSVTLVDTEARKKHLMLQTVFNPVITKKEKKTEKKKT